MDTEKETYADRLIGMEARWKRLLDVQRPYRRHLQRLKPGFVLEIGCGLGRNLTNLGGNAGVGIDHNPWAIAVARSRGLTAFTPEEFKDTAYAEAGSFDTVLFSHVVEHMGKEEAAALLRTYLPYVRTGGRVIFITPQERGFRSDPTHVTFMDFAALAGIASGEELTLEKQYSFPLPRWSGSLFTYNEFVAIYRMPLCAACRQGRTSGR